MSTKKVLGVAGRAGHEALAVLLAFSLDGAAGFISIIHGGWP